MIWRLTGGKLHATDATNASRTLLLNLHTSAWDDELCRYFKVPAALLPEVRPSAADFGVTHGLDFLPDGLPILGSGGRSAGGLVRSVLLRGGRGEMHLWHRGILPATHRSRAETVALTGC